MVGMSAEFETALRKERQMEGIAAAKERGVYKGRRPSIDRDQIMRRGSARPRSPGSWELAARPSIGAWGKWLAD